MIFADTSALFAAFVAGDPNHAQAEHQLDLLRSRLLTTDYVVDELLTLMRARRQFQEAIVFGDKVLGGRFCRLEFVREKDIQDGWQYFRTYRDKLWSFTDCVSRAVMERLDIQTAFAFDEHFRQFGTVTVVP